MTRLISLSTHRRLKLATALIVLLFFVTFQAVAQAPTITSISPTSTFPGGSLTITGSGFNATPANNTVFFGGAKATVTSVPNTNTITVTVPAGAAYGPISVVNTVNNRSAISLQNFVPIFSPSRSTVNSADFTSTGAALADGAAVTQLWQVAAADLDGDGKLEMITLNNGENKVFIRTNTGSAGNISFGASNSYTLAATPGAMAIADMDGDGRLDIVVTLRSPQHSIVVLRNTGDLSAFSVSSSFGVVSNPNSVAVADINADGRPDVLTGSSSISNLSVLENNSSGAGNISFAATVVLPLTGFVFATSVSISDMDGNGKPDIVTSADGSGNYKVVIYPNTGNAGDAISTGTFGSVQETVVSNLARMAVGDLDADGLPDILLTSSSGNSILTLVNAGSFIFNQTSRNLGHFTSFISIAELNGDGRPDMLVVRHSSTSAYIYPNASTAGSINFGTGLQLATGTAPISVAAADLDGDTRPDVLIGNATDHSVSLYRNTLTDPLTISSFSPASAAPGATVIIAGTNFNTTAGNNTVFFGPVKAAAASVNGTATSITVTVPSGAGYGPVFVLNNGTGLSAYSTQHFTPVFSPNKPTLITSDITRQSIIASGTGSLIYSLGTSDLNDDGKPDLIMTTGSIDDRVYFRTNTSTGSTVSFASATSIAVPGGLSRTDVQLSVGDLDGDTRPDLVVPGKNASAFTILKNNGSMNFTSTIVSGGFSPTGSAIRDFDNDGKPDIAIAANSGSRAFVYPNTTIAPGAIALSSAITLTASSNVQNIFTADLDGDGRQDLIAPYGTWTDIGVYRNTSSVGAISFAAVQDITVFSATHSPDNVLISDLDGDNKPDLVITDGNLSTPVLAVLRNTSTVGSISFSVTTVSVPYAQNYASLGDVNGDGRADLVFNLVTGFGGSTATQYRIGVMNNTSSGGGISFANPITIGSGSTHLPVGSNVVNDLNGDGRPDIIASHQNSGQISIYSSTPQFAPAISSIAPLSAAPGSSVVITGTGFGSSNSTNIVRFGTVTATVTAASITSLTVTVPQNAAYGTVSVLNSSNTLAASGLSFFTPAFTPNKTGLTATDFTQQGNLSITGSLYGMAAGDLTGDGKPELVVVNASNTGTLIMLPNTSTAGEAVNFGTATVITPIGGTFAEPRYTAMGDLDGNGWLDIAATAINSNTVTVFLNSGTGTLGTALTQTGTYTTGLGPIGVAIGDLDGDGKPEMVTSNNLASSVSVFRNTSTVTGAVSFTAKQDFQVSASQAVYDMALADIDNDGKLDIIASRDINGQPGKIVLLRNTSIVGSISFTPTVEIDGPRAPWSMVPGDLNSDGLTDFVASAGGSASTQVFAYTKLSSGGALNNLTITQLNVEKDNIAIGLADLNGDGKPDLVSGTRSAVGGNYFTYVFPNTSSGGNTSFGTRINLPGFVLPLNTVVTDMNADGRPDILVGNGDNNPSTVTVFRNTLLAPPVINTIAPVTAAAGTPVSISGRNFNTTTTNNIVYFGQVRATVTGATATSLTATVPTSASFAPVTVFNTASGLMGASSQVFNRTFSPSKSTLHRGDFISGGNIADGSAGGTYLSGVLAIDLNEDGKPELVTLNAPGKTLYIRSNTGTPGTVNVNTTIGTYDLSSIGEPWHIAAGDMDRDGKPDLVVGFLNEHRVIVLRNGGDLANMTISGQFATGTNPIDLHLADVNSDGRLDVLTTTPNSSNASVLQNTSTGAGDINFNTKVDLALGASCTGVLVADMDGNGRPDVMVVRKVSGVYSLSVFSNIGNAGDNISNATFAARQDIPVAAGSKRMAAADMDGDGVLDIVLSNESQSIVSVLRNNNVGGFSFTESTYAVSSTSHAIAVSDLNGDGKPDVLVSTTGNSNSAVNMLANNSTAGNVALASAVMLSAPIPYDNDIADMDGDGKPDIISGSGTARNFIVFRNALLFAPATQALNVSAGSLTASSATISWTNGNGQRRNVFMSAASSGEPAPADLTDYTAHTQFGSGSQISSTGWYCVFNNNTGTSVNVTGLSPATTYRVMVIEYNNNGQATAAVYQTATATNNPINFTTRATVISLSTTGSSATKAATVDYTLLLSGNITGLSNANFSLSTSGITGASVTGVTGSGNSFTITVNTGTGNGTLQLNLANATGIAPGLTNTLLFAGGTYTIDKTAPVLNPVSIASNHTTSSLAKQGNAVTLSFTSSEPINTPTVTIATHTVTATNTSGNNWTASYTMTGSDAEDIVPFSIAYADMVGNAGTLVTGTTNSSSVIYDRSNPTLSTVAIGSSNGNSRAKEGDIITLNFTSNEGVIPSATIAGHAITPVNTSGNAWTASYTMTAGDAEGTVSFSITFNDQTGNAGTAVAATTNSSAVVFDKTVPELTSVSIASNNTSIARARTGDLVTVSFTATETIQSPTVLLATHSVTAINASGNIWSASYTMTGTDAEGTVPFSIVFSDLAGNTGATATGTTNSSAVMFDKTVPVLSVIGIVSNNANVAKAKTGDLVTVSFTATETIQSPTVLLATHGVTAINTSGNIWSAAYTMTGTDAEGTIPFSIVYSDLTGNPGSTVTATSNSSSVLFDKTSPSLSAVTVTSNNSISAKARIGSKITLNFTASEPITSPSVSIAGHMVTALNVSANAWTAVYTMTGSDAEGAVPFSIAFNDLAGNIGTTVTTTTNSSSVLFDKTLPSLTSVTIVSNNDNTEKAKIGSMVTLRFTASETIIPSVLVAAHAVTPVNISANVWTAVYTMTGNDAEGLVPFGIAFNDLAGNTGATVTSVTGNSSVVFDKTLPELQSVIIASGNIHSAWAKKSDMIVLTFRSSETIATPTVTLATKMAAVSNTGGNNWLARYTMTSGDAEGVVPFSISFTDLASNTGITITGASDNSKVVYDTTAPELKPVTILSDNAINQLARPGNIVSVVFTASETVLSPTIIIASHSMSATAESGNKWRGAHTMTVTDPEGTIPFSITAVDMAGNITVATASSDNSIVDFRRSGGPVFTNGSLQDIAICRDAATDINNLLRVTYLQTGKPLTITVTGAPAHGTLTGFAATMLSNGATITPSGLVYKPAAGYTGLDTFTALVSDGTFTATTTLNITVAAIPSATITATGGTSLCEGSSLVLTGTGGNSYRWYKDGILIGNTSSQLTATSAGAYSLVAINLTGCESTATGMLTVTLISRPQAEFTVGANSCLDVPVSFANKSVVANSGTINYLWSDGRGLTTAAVSPSFTYTQTGTYSVKLEVVPETCPSLAANITKTISITQALAGIRNPTMDIAKNEPTKLSIRTITGASYQWSPARFLLSANIPDPVTVASAEQEYRISLKIPNGCVTVDTLLVRLHANTTAYVPNVFTPNGDGQNDRLMPNLVGLTKLRFFRIFNRWGRLMFETTNIGQGWDGRFKGELQPMETYTWSIEGSDANNNLVKRQGSVTLLR